MNFFPVLEIIIKGLKLLRKFQSHVVVVLLSCACAKFLPKDRPLRWKGNALQAGIPVPKNVLIIYYYNLLKNRLLTKLAAWLRSFLPKNFGKIMKTKQTTRQGLCW